MGDASSSTAEATSIQLEFKYLSHITNDSKYADAVNKVMEVVANNQKQDGLVPIYINPKTGKFKASSRVTLGARGDSYYEYLLKQWLITNKTEDSLRQEYVRSMAGVVTRLIQKTKVPFKTWEYAQASNCNTVSDSVCVHVGRPQTSLTSQS